MDRSADGDDLGFGLERAGDAVADGDSTGCGAGALTFIPVTTLMVRFSALFLFGPICGKRVVISERTPVVSWLSSTYIYIHLGVPFTRNLFLQDIVDNQVDQKFFYCRFVEMGERAKGGRVRW